MSLIVGENSYVSVDEATAYFADRLFADEWESSPDKEKLLIAATRRIDRLPFKGIKADRTQALEFPRALYSYSRGINPYHDPLRDNLHTLPGWIVQQDVPQAVKDATCEEAISILKGAQEAAKRADLQRQGVTSFSLGSLSESYSGGSQGIRLMSAEAHDLLAPYLGGGRPIA